MNARSTSSTLLLACAGALALAAACEDGARPTTRGRVVDDEPTADASTPPEAGGGEPEEDASPPPPDASSTTLRDSCAAILRADATLAGKDGRYLVDLDGQGPMAPLGVYCDMTTAGGGWTLVARSVDGGDAEHWGWKFANGTVDDDATPYSLDLGKNPIAGVSQLLVGSYSAGKKWLRAFRFNLPGAFVSAYGAMGVELGTWTTVAGDCVPNPPAGGPQLMLSWVGYTAHDGYFFFRDIDALEGFGLFPGGFNLAEATCDRSAALVGAQGMIMVR